MDTLVIGYGKIGRIKAHKWHSLGRRVLVRDTDPKKSEQAVADGFTLFGRQHSLNEDLLIDISTPAACHFDSLKWALDNIQESPRLILIEKPVASNLAELDKMMALVSKSGRHWIQNRVVINESYFLSSALRFVADDIRIKHGNILKIKAELSKNRMGDIVAGRFVDENLGSMGIELPHMIAMLQLLGVRPGQLETSDVKVYEDSTAKHNEGFRAEMEFGKTHIELASFLGDFRVQGEERMPNDVITRKLFVQTERYSYKVSFDPINDCDRYKSKVVKLDNSTREKEEIILDDDHLTEHLMKLHCGATNEDIDTFLGIDNAVGITHMILELKSAAKYLDINQLTTSRIPEIQQTNSVARKLSSK